MKPFPVCALLATLATLALSATLLLAEPELEVDPETLPRIPATDPEAALETFELHPGFRLVLAAHEPDVCDPIAMCFDEEGRAYVLEMRGYSERRDEALGRVRLLTDRDGDGVFDESIVFKDGLRWPTAIACYRGGVFVGATPDLFYLRDNDGDGVCDEERAVFTGFGGGNLKLNMQALFNSLRWGPDNRIWGATAANGGTVTRPDDPEFEPVSLRGADFSFDPEKLDLRAENGTAQYGMSFDSEGRRFVCSNSRHLIWVAYERGQVRPNPWFSLPPALVNIPNDGAAAPVYRISPDEPWRIVRTRWRVSGVVKGIVEGGGRVSGYFTSATGVHLYWGDAFGEEFRDNAFVGDVGSNLVHRKIIRPAHGSATLVGLRPDPNEKTEFLRSRDNWFRPTSFATGPDGCLYVTDMYREVIEHPWSLPESIKEHLDLNSGFDRGRIYRIEPEGFSPSKPHSLVALTDEQLLVRSFLPNDWAATTARRLLYERGNPAPPPESGSAFPAALQSETARFDLLEEARSDPWIRAAFLNSLRRPEDLTRAWEQISALDSRPLAEDLLGMIGRCGDESLLADVSGDLASQPFSVDLAAGVLALLDGRRHGGKTGGSPPSLELWTPLLDSARNVLRDRARSGEDRSAAVSLLDRLGGPAEQEFLEATLLSDPDPAIARSLVAAIGDLEFLARHLASVPSPGRTELGNRILSDDIASSLILEQVREETLSLGELPASLTEGLRKHRTESVRKLADEVLPPVVSRLDVIERYRGSLALEADRERGKAAFLKACAACHRSHEGEGIELGPSIDTFASAGAESLLERILDPNREIAPQFQAFVFELDDGSLLTGMITHESPEEVTLAMPGGIQQTFLRTKVKSMKGLGLSLMPEGLEASLSLQDMADLLRYLSSSQP